MPHKDPEAAKAYKRAYYRDYRKGIRRTDRSELSDEEVVRRYKKRVEKQNARKRKYGVAETSDTGLIIKAKSKPCVDCGVVLPYQVMHLDHVHGKKKFKLSERSQAKLPKDPVKRQKIILEELAKCETRCPNCHRMRHWRLGEIGNPEKRDFQVDHTLPNPLMPPQDVWEERGKKLGIELLGKVTHTKVPIEVRCMTCFHQWDLNPVYLTTGKASCPECALERRRLSQEVWDQRAEAVGIMWLEPARSNEKRSARCLNCSKEFKIKGSAVEGGTGCRECRNKDRGKKQRLPQETWDKRIATVNARWLEPVKTSETKTRAECLKCGDVWDAWPSRIQQGNGCSECKKREKVWVPNGYAKEALDIIHNNPGITQAQILKLMPQIKNNGTLTYPLKRLREKGFVIKDEKKRYTAK